MILAELLQNINCLEIVGSTDKEIQGIEFDSRKAKHGIAFVAQCGATVDGHKFIPSAIDSGSSVIICEEIPTEVFPEITFIKVIDSNEVLGKLAAAFYDSPSKKN